LHSRLSSGSGKPSIQSGKRQVQFACCFQIGCVIRSQRKGLRRCHDVLDGETVANAFDRLRQQDIQFGESLRAAGCGKNAASLSDDKSVRDFRPPKVRHDCSVSLKQESLSTGG